MRQGLRVIFFSFLLTANNCFSFCGDWLNNLKAPICSSYQVFFPGALLTTAIMIEDRNTNGQLRKKINKRKPLKGSAKFFSRIGDGWLNWSYAATFLIAGWSFNKPHMSQKGQTMAEASFYSAGIAWILKQTIKETRPGFADEEDSFPSAHATNAFAFASVVGAIHDWPWGVAAYTVAALITFGRINDDRHFLHDVVAGATLGLSYGLGIYWNFKEEKVPYWFSVVPNSQFKAPQLVFSMEF